MQHEFNLGPLLAELLDELGERPQKVGTGQADLHPGMPAVPTTAEAGLKGFELEAWVGIFAPAATPADVVAKLSDQIKAALELPETRTRADGAGVELRYLPPRRWRLWSKKIPISGPGPSKRRASRRSDFLGCGPGAPRRAQAKL